MKKRLFALLIAGSLCLTGCQSGQEKQQAELMKAFEQMGVEHDEVIMSVLSKEWKVLDSEDTYRFTKEGTGDVSGKGFTYSCGFNEENDILLRMVMADTAEEKHYIVSADDTGHGLYLEAAAEKEVLHLFLKNAELLDVKEQEPVMIGEWADKSDNRYILKEDMTMVIKSPESEKKGTYSVVRRDNVPLLTLVFGSHTLEFEYELLDENTLRLCAPGTETVHTWIKK